MSGAIQSETCAQLTGNAESYSSNFQTRLTFDHPASDRFVGIFAGKLRSEPMRWLKMTRPTISVRIRPSPGPEARSQELQYIYRALMPGSTDVGMSL